MARFFSNSNLVSAYVHENISIALKSRGYATAATQVEVSRKSKMMFVEAGEKGSKAVAHTPWVPDPKTGYYRPQIVDHEVDAAQLRQELLNNKIHPN